MVGKRARGATCLNPWPCHFSSLAVIELSGRVIIAFEHLTLTATQYVNTRAWESLIFEASPPGRPPAKYASS